MWVATWLQTSAALLIAASAVWMGMAANQLRQDQEITRLAIQGTADIIVRDRADLASVQTRLLLAGEKHNRMLRLICRNYAETARDRAACETP